MNPLFFIFCFLNLYSPISTNITFVFNVSLFIYVYIKRPRLIIEWVFLFIPVLLLLISYIAFSNTRDTVIDNSTFGIYARMLVNCISFPSIIAFFYRKNVKFFQILSLTLLLHCFAIFIQLILPQLQDLNSVLFRFERDDVDMADYSLRRLGLSGGYDQSALYAVLSCVLSTELYFRKMGKKYLSFIIISFIASLFTSRTGMLVSVLSLLFCAICNFKELKFKLNFSTVIVVGLIGGILLLFILPIVLNSLGVSFGHSSIDTDSQYSSRTVEYLFDMQLYPLLILSKNELLFGYGCGVNKSSALLLGSDIGYVKQIFHVGLLGVSLMIVFSFLMAIRTFRRKKRLRYDKNMKISSQLMWILFPIYLIFNYKNHLLYNVCYFEVFLFIYYYSCYHYYKTLYM